MASIPVDEDRIKDLLKQAIVELLEEREDLLTDVFVEALEEVAMTNAIKEGEGTQSVSRSEISKVLDGIA
jgi:ribosomal protein L12E/L44/L45/RPP1/RPP2